MTRIGNDGCTNETLLFTDKSLAVSVAEDYTERERNASTDPDQILVEEYTGEGEMEEGDAHVFDSYRRDRVITAALANFGAKHAREDIARMGLRAWLRDGSDKPTG